MYLHWFDHVFHRADGPAQWAKAKLVRYADDFVVLARYVSPRLRDWLEGKLEGWLGLQINREKTRVLDLRQPGQSLDFLGYTFRQDRDQYGRPQRYWNLVPSRKAVARERETLRGLISPQQCSTPLPELVGRLNRHLRGWANYFGLGYPRNVFRHLNHFVRYRLGQHLQRRSQRGWRARKGVSLYAHFGTVGTGSFVNAFWKRRLWREPDGEISMSGSTRERGAAVIGPRTFHPVLSSLLYRFESVVQGTPAHREHINSERVQEPWPEPQGPSPERRSPVTPTTRPRGSRPCSRRCSSHRWRCRTSRSRPRRTARRSGGG
ncbi:MAG: hypothetical protein M5U12_34365 [Verrucomicrobia bacterium]|nr:hypothetical protein [Verrucomicrobiota bacterium]